MIKSKFVITTLAAIIALTQPAFAQDNSSTPSTIFEEIVVTAQKRSQSIYDVPVAISAFSAESLEQRGVSDLIDAGKFVPNLTVTSFSAGHSSAANPFIRGIGLQDHLITTDPGVGVYIDGVYLGRQIGQNWTLANIERLEVLRGPQGTLYGRNSIGGAINIITRKPGEENTARISTRVGSRGRLDGDIYGSYKVSDQLAISGLGAFKSRDGLGDFVNLNTGTEVGEMRDLSGRLSVYWTPTADFSVLFSADGNDGEGGLNPYTTLIDEINGVPVMFGLRNTDVSSDRYDNNTGQADVADTENSSSGFSVALDYALSDQLNVKLLASRRTSDYKAGLDDDSTIFNFAAFPEVGEADQVSVELQLNGDYGQLDFVSGLYYFDEDGENDQPNATFSLFELGETLADLGEPSSELLKQETTSYAVYANVGYRISEDLRIAGGLRYTEDEKDAAVNIAGFIDAIASEKFTEVSWELSATYEINDNLTAYGTVASGFQSGQFNARPFCLFGDFFGAGMGAFTPTPNCFDQELDNITALNYEVGVKGQPFEILQMSLAVFFTQYKDLPYQVSTTVDGGFNTANMIVDQDSRGIEWESSLRLFEGFFLNTSLGFIDVDVDNPEAEAPLTPELTAAVALDYSIPLSFGGSLNLHVDYSFRDEMFGEPTSLPGRLTQIDSRDLVNFDVGYLSPDESWQVSIYGKNVNDERYINAKVNTGDYLIQILSNDASEFGMRAFKEF